MRTLDLDTHSSRSRNPLTADIAPSAVANTNTRSSIFPDTDDRASNNKHLRSSGKGTSNEPRNACGKLPIPPPSAGHEDTQWNKWIRNGLPPEISIQTHGSVHLASVLKPSVHLDAHVDLIILDSLLVTYPHCLRHCETSHPDRRLGWCGLSQIIAEMVRVLVYLEQMR